VKAEQLTTAVLMGGPGREREVSIESGRCVAEALEQARPAESGKSRQAGVKVVVADVRPDELSILDDKTIDVFFVAIHGTFGEDGALQEIMESKGLVYTGSGPEASRLAFDKWASKQRFAEAGVATPKAIKLQPNEKDAELERQIAAIGRRYVVKPVHEGSTIGISIAENAKAALEAGRKCAAEFGDCMIEEFIPGREITVSVLGKEALPILEIRARGGFYDYQAKYLDEGTEYLFDTIGDAALAEKIQKSAIQCFMALRCRGAARVDYILGEDGTPYALEINTIPGMTKHSLLPKAAEKAGISMSQLCLKMVEMALAESGEVHKTGIRRQ